MAAILPPLVGPFTKRGFVDPSTSNPDHNPDSRTTGKVFLAFDALISESPDYQAAPTQSQVEDGATISDHVTPRPLKLTVHGVISDTPVSLIRAPSSLFSTPLPSQRAFAYLEKLFFDRIPFDFVGGYRVYKSMIITAFTPMRSKESADALMFSCVMEQVRTVSSDIVPDYTFKEPKKAAPKKSAGTRLMESYSSKQQTVVDAAGNDVNARSLGF